MTSNSEKFSSKPQGGLKEKRGEKEKASLNKQKSREDKQENKEDLSPKI